MGTGHQTGTGIRRRFQWSTGRLSTNHYKPHAVAEIPRPMAVWNAAMVQSTVAVWYQPSYLFFASAAGYGQPIKVDRATA